MRIQIDYHYSFDSLSRLQVMHCQRNIRVNAETTATVEASMMETS